MEVAVENPSIKNWLKKVIHTKKNTKTPDVFGVPLYQSLRVASTPIAYEDKDTVIGTIPIIVAKCGSFLKDQGLYVEGVFRKSGSAKRLGELQHHFNSSPDFGISLNWRGFTVHDAANCLRRFLNYLPEPVILFSLYEPFRQVAASDHDSLTTIQEYQRLIDQLPVINQYLLFYLLDLLALFGRYAKYTKMDTMSLASVFTPGILLNPDHAMCPAHYKLSQRVVHFLIEHQDRFHLPKQKGLDRQASTISKHSLYNTIQQQSNNNNNNNNSDRLNRANTVPVHKNRFGPNDPLQVINK